MVYIASSGHHIEHPTAHERRGCTDVESVVGVMDKQSSGVDENLTREVHSNLLAPPMHQDDITKDPPPLPHRRVSWVDTGAALASSVVRLLHAPRRAVSDG